MLAQHLGSSLAADTAASGVNYDWMQEFSDQASGLGVTFKPTIIGFGAVLDNLSAFLDDTTRPVVIVGAAGAYIVLWLFVAGGIIDRYARDRADARARLLRGVRRVLLPVPAARRRDVDRVRLAVRGTCTRGCSDGCTRAHARRHGRADRLRRSALALYLVFGVAGRGVQSRLRLREGTRGRRRPAQHARRARRGACASSGDNRGAAAGSLSGRTSRCSRRRSRSTRWSRPARAAAGWSMWIGVRDRPGCTSLARLWVKLVFWASETALFQSRLAHAGYVATPQPTWPESPAAEAIVRLTS